MNLRAGRAAALDAEADDRARALRQQPLRQRVIGMALERRVQHPRDRRVLLQETSTAAVLAMCRAMRNAQRLDALQQMEGIGGDMQAPKSRRPSARARMMKAAGPNSSAKTMP